MQEEKSTAGGNLGKMRPAGDQVAQPDPMNDGT
jgi:hypothetical protein